MNDSDSALTTDDLRAEERHAVLADRLAELVGEPREALAHGQGAISFASHAWVAHVIRPVLRAAGVRLCRMGGFVRLGGDGEYVGGEYVWLSHLQAVWEGLTIAYRIERCDEAAALVYQITSGAGVDLGTYDSTSREEALDAMAREAGYADHATACRESGDDGAHLVVSERTTCAEQLLASDSEWTEVTRRRG